MFRSRVEKAILHGGHRMMLVDARPFAIYAVQAGCQPEIERPRRSAVAMHQAGREGHIVARGHLNLARVKLIGPPGFA